MACKGNLTGSILGAAGSFITNGALPEVFGDSPLSSLAGVPVEVTDAITGEVLSPTLNTLVSSINDIGGQEWFSDLGDTLTAMGGAGFTDAMTEAWNNIPSIAGSGALADAIGGFTGAANSVLTNVTAGLNDAVNFATSWAGETIGGAGSLVGGVLSGDAKKFGTILSTANSFVANANDMINAATNSNFLGSTFTNIDNLVSGGLSGVNLDFSGFGAEIAKLGGTINLSNLDALGSPGEMLKNMVNEGTLGPMYEKLAAVTVDPRTLGQLGVNLVQVPLGNTTLGSLGLDLNTIAQLGSNLPADIQQQIYRGFEELDSTAVTQVKNILKNTQEFVETGADLFDPTKLFPESFQTLTAPLKTASVGFRAIYTDQTGSVNQEFEKLGANLTGIVPDDVAIANGALARSLGQIKNIAQSTPTALGTATQQLETLKDLPLLENQTSYVTQAVQDYWTETYTVDASTNIELGTGTNGQLRLSDVIGFAAGYNSAAPLKQNATLLQQLQDNGDFAVFTNDAGPTSSSTGLYYVIQYFCAGNYGPTEVTPGNWQVVIPSGVYGAGTYTGATSTAARENAWVNGLVPATKTLIESFNSNETAQLVVRNSTRWNQQLAREYLNQSKADNADLTAVQASDDVAINLATSLPELGLDTGEGGSAELLERIVNFNSIGGQSVIASMREGRNLARLAAANIQDDAPIDTTGVATEGTLLSGQYTAAEAQQQIIKS